MQNCIQKEVIKIQNMYNNKELQQSKIDVNDEWLNLNGQTFTCVSVHVSIVHEEIIIDTFDYAGFLNLLSV